MIIPKDHENIIKMYVIDKISAKQIAKQYKVDKRKVRAILGSNGVQLRDITERTFRKHPLNKDFFKVIDTEEKAYILGFLFADGCVSAVNLSTRINCSIKDIDHLTKMGRHIHLSDIKDHIKIYSNEKAGYKSCYIDFHSKDIRNDLIALGCTPNKSAVLKFPELDENLVSHFMRGYHDGDGCIHYKNPKNIAAKDPATCVISSNEFIDYWNKILKHKLNVNTYNRIYNDKIKISCINGAHQTRRFLDFIYKDATIYLDRKYEKYLDICEFMKYSKKPMKEYTITSGMPNIDSNFIDTIYDKNPEFDINAIIDDSQEFKEILNKFT